MISFENAYIAERDAESTVRDNIKKVRECLVGIERSLDNSRVLNRLGELQALGVQLDCSIATLATIRSMIDAW